MEPQCSICLDDMDVAGGVGVDVLQCFHVFHKQCVHTYLKTASETGLAALTVNDEMRAALACPQCKEKSGMRVAYGPSEDSDGEMEQGGGQSMVLGEHS